LLEGKCAALLEYDCGWTVATLVRLDILYDLFYVSNQNTLHMYIISLTSRSM
jgi:hypothetical protein